MMSYHLVRERVWQFTQIQNSLTMDSNEDKLHLWLLKAKLNNAKEKSKMYQLQFAREKKEEKSSSGQSFSSASDTSEIDIC